LKWQLFAETNGGSTFNEEITVTYLETY